MTDRITEQKKEIQSIKPRTLTLNLSDKGVERLALKAAAAGLSVGELLENFANDLTNGVYSNGSDERMFAESWFERCWFSSSTRTFLQHLAKTGELDEVWDNWIEYQSLLEDLRHETDLTPSELSECRHDAAQCARYIQNIYAAYDSAGSWEQGMQEITDWKRSLHNLLYGSSSRS